jgi:hypothetical protein
MKTTRILIMGLTFCGATMFMTSCGGSGDGEGDDHATQNETSIDTDETMNNGAMDDDISEDTTMTGDTTTTM